MTPAERGIANQRALVRELDRVFELCHPEGHQRQRDDVPQHDDLSTIVRRFRLSAFERDVLLLCAGVELDPRFAELRPTFGFALSVLPDAHWSAVTPRAPLRAWRLVEHTGPSVTAGAIRIDERILHFLAGVNELDDRLRGFAEPLLSSADSSEHGAITTETIASFQADHPTSVQLSGGDADVRRTIATSAASALGAAAIRIRADDIPVSVVERSSLARLVARETMLANVLPIVDVGANSDSARIATIAAFLEDLGAACVITTAEPIRTLGVDVANVTIATTSRIAIRPRLDALAQRIEAKAAWEDLVLPDAQIRALRDLAMHVRQRDRVYNDWGFADKSARGLGISALFAGSSGTGKTMAAEVLARELNMDLYRVDLARIVSKYIGETEKNLDAIFSAAEHSDVVLLFDEADALFGKRTEVRDSHDRYANVEISYLLQRMESFQGLAILTTNMKQSLDPAFLRRLRFVVQFPFPHAEHRAEIWKGMFPSRTPVDSLDFLRLSQLNLAGGNIRNVALGGAFLAADRGEHVTMSHLAEAARSEYAKLERPLSDAEGRGWA
jgi:ATP-dependent 26S proteasome regulatory subunit